MKSPPLDNTHGRQRRAWHDITSLGQHTAGNVGCGMASPPLDSTHGRRRAWHAIIAFGQHTRSNDVRRGMPSWSWTPHMIERRRVWHDITALGLHALSDDVGRGMTLPPLNSTHGRTMSGVECHHRPWTTRMVERRRAWHDITTLGQHR